MASHFSKDSGNLVEECKLKVNYVAPQPPSPVREGSDEGSSPTTSISDNNFNAVPRGYAESHEKSSEVIL
ncbi:hypothetical protein L2E82_15268 [Cichorium intybus]|uniref:Uncharacterized protein n=1 Tax=Cichorium intybus TaxID=13427 RepID=A0ACB9F2X1_CICIN|nr:hypothetical protein L2E82_15268 [Cichorium intybus]